MKEPTVTIVVPCYNYGHYLADTLKNIQQQEYESWECIIVDDGSTDDSGAIAAEFTSTDSRYRYVYQQNKGLSAARNFGISESRGKYIQFLDSDDFIHPAKIKQQLTILERNKEFDITYGNSLFFFDNDLKKLYFSRKKGTTVSGSNSLRISGRGHSILKKFLINNIMEVSCALIKKQLIIQTGGFDETYKSYEDWKFWIECALKDAYFDYSPVEGTETYIRCGHGSMMSNKKNLVLHGVRIRKFLHPHINFFDRLLNYKGLAKLYIRKWFKIF